MARLIVVLGGVVAGIVACSSGSGSGSSGAGGDGTVTYSCLVTANSLCTQILVLSSEVSAEDQQCTTIQSGTSGTGCPTTGLVGCCQKGGESMEADCYYSASEASIGKMACSQGTWTTTL